MADVARLNLTEKGAEARLRSLLEDLVGAFAGPEPASKPALAVWFAKTPHSDVQRLLVLFSGNSPNRLDDPVSFPLRWKRGEQGPPFAEVSATSVDHFSQLLTLGTKQVRRFFDAPEVLAFDKSLLNEPILQAFNIMTEPQGLMKGWYIDADQYGKLAPAKNLLSYYANMKPHLGMVKTYESPDFKNCRGLLHFEFDQKWMPVSLNGLRVHNFFNDLQERRAGRFLFQGGSLYQLLKIEEKAEPEYSKLVLKRLPDDRYPEVYLRSVHPPAEPAA